MFDFFFWKSEKLPLPYKREIHCHLIPGVDDGSTSMDFSLKALAFLEKYGVEKVIFTPHYTYPKFINTPANIAPIFDDVKANAKKKKIEIECENFSFEYRVDRSFEKMIPEKDTPKSECQLRPLTGKWILIENAWKEPYPRLFEVVENLKELDYKVILAHPERYGYFAEKPGDFYYKLHDQGIYFQCNMLSFAGYYGKIEKEVAHWMLKKGFVNFLGSDMHNKRHIEYLTEYLKSRDYSDYYDQFSDNILTDLMRR